MPDLGVWGKLIMFIGGGLFLLGLLFFVGGKFLSLGKLSGDIFIQKGNFSFYFPVISSLLISIILTIILNLFRR